LPKGSLFRFRKSASGGIYHCSRCKRRTGSAFGIVAYFAENDVQVTSGVLKTYEYRSDTNRWVKTQFCLSCGTTVMWTAECFLDGRAPGIAVGTFDNPYWIQPQSNVWTGSALSWVIFPPGVESHETQPSG
jgi:hypothetical protein